MSIVGTSLGKYRILSELSTGGMGEVYRGQHEILGKAVAIKVLRPERTGDPQQLTRFINEAKAASAIQHPGIIRVDDFGTTEDGRSYLVMEFLEGETLSDRIRKQGKLADKDAAKIAQGICSALQAAHDKGIYHRDLKPDNVFLVRDPDVGERLKLLDFGIAKLTDVSGNTQTGALMGTPLYMAPEQARAAAEVDHRADLYSLGCILYELVVGEPPFLGTGAGEIIALQMFEVPKPPRKRVPTISAAVERVVLRLLEKEPADRFQSAAEVATALANLDAKPAPVWTVKHAPPARRANRLPVIAGAITVAIAGAVVFVVTRPSDDPPAKTATPPPLVEEPLAPAPPPAPPVVEQPVVAPTTVKTPKKRPRQPTVTKPAHDDQHTKTGSPIELTP